MAKLKAHVARKAKNNHIVEAQLSPLAVVAFCHKSSLVAQIVCANDFLTCLMCHASYEAQLNSTKVLDTPFLTSAAGPSHPGHILFGRLFHWHDDQRGRAGGQQI